jgi:predicted DNA-binding transcriptional regulator AlpA
MPVEIDQVSYMTADEVADLARVSRQTLWRWRQDGSVPQGLRYRGKQLLFTQADVQQVLDFAHRIEPAELGRVADRGDADTDYESNFD